MIRIEVRTLGNGRVLLQVGDEWHMVLLPNDAAEVAQAMTAAAFGNVTITALAEDLHCGPWSAAGYGPKDRPWESDGPR